MTEPLPADDLVPPEIPYSTGVADEPVWLPESSILDTMARWWQNAKLASKASAPSAFNWDDRQVVPVAEDQEDTQACICYASCMAAATLYRIKTDKTASFAPRVMHACSIALALNMPTRSDKLAEAAIRFGLPNTVDPVEASRAAALSSKAQCSLFASTPRLKVTSITRFHSPEEAKAALRFTGPIVVHMDLTDHFRDHYAAGTVYTAPPGAKVLTSHAVCVIGYDDTKECWICVNSFGPNWRGTTGGRFMLKYGECRVLATGAAAYRLDIQV